MIAQSVALVVITFAAATINGALGYGFSSITVPLALIFLTNRVLNPALVLIEVALNAYILVIHRSMVPVVWKRVAPILIGLVPGIVVGTAIVVRVSPAWVKLGTLVALLPVILAQAAGYRRALRPDRAPRVLFGGALGTLYSVTTVSGPPLAVALSGDGLSKREFRAALGVVRLSESVLTALAYLSTRMISAESLGLVPLIVPSIAVGIPLGAYLVRRAPATTFWRLRTSFDAWIVGFGLALLLHELRIVPTAVAFAIAFGIIAIDLCLLLVFFARTHGALVRSPEVS